MTWLALILACAVSSVIWYLGLTWCAPAFLAIACGVCLAILWCKDLGEGVFEKGSGAPCRRCGAPAWMHWTVKP